MDNSEDLFKDEYWKQFLVFQENLQGEQQSDSINNNRKVPLEAMEFGQPRKLSSKEINRILLKLLEGYDSTETGMITNTLHLQK